MNRNAESDAPNNDAVEEIAARWVARQTGRVLAPAEKRSLDGWLDAAPAHRRAYERIRSTDSLIIALGAEPSILDLRRRALARRADRWSVSLFVATLAACAVVAIGLMEFGDRQADSELRDDEHALQLADSRYTTTIGERAAFNLPDGSVMMLNTNSVAQVIYVGRRRSVHLIKGEAFFTVAKDPSRPFEVFAADNVVTALGTAFDVRVRDGGMTMALVEGRVRVAPRRGSQAARSGVIVNAGEVLSVRNDGVAAIRPADTRPLTSWSRGQLIFDNTPLGEAVAEMNRYSATNLIVGSDGIGSLKVTGVFRAGDVDRFADAATEVFNLRKTRSANGEIILERRAP
ncbi:FecR family protein [Aquamicrobium terrae]|uniref:Transmembrane sensor n=1 Tax=Aquamicrobium terrae TaxID=1324945 RepID=A0ABV2N6B5_9HYPH